MQSQHDESNLRLTETDSMMSTNFEFLRAKHSELAELGGFAEQYVYSDPTSALVKLRAFAEQVVNTIYAAHKLPKPLQPNLNDLMNASVFTQIVPPVIISKFNTLRIKGNKAAHGENVTSNIAGWVLQEAFDIGRWVYLTFDSGIASDLPKFKPVPTSADLASQTDELKKEREEIQKKLASQEERLKQVLDELEKQRAKAQSAEKSLEELQSIAVAGQAAAKQLHFNEAETRKHLIDSELSAAGWNVGENKTSTSEVGQEVPVDNQPTKSKSGAADYVLWDDNGKPLAVIEAKQTSISPEAGRTQAKLYADGLEKRHGQRPIIFYSNGYETHIWNDWAGEPPRRIYGLYSKQSLQYAHFQNKERLPLNTIKPDESIAGRPYQIEAVTRVMERFGGKHRKALLVQATGTGKTRVAISICDALIRARHAKRVLFLCDRLELQKQAYNAFKDYLPHEPRVIISPSTFKEKDKRIFLATYPAMMSCFETFDVGFFDLIIADESHRSIYNRYRDIFEYFDALQVGLTATPVKFIEKNTYKMFRCEDQDPTAHYSYEEAISHKPPYLSEFRVATMTTKFLKRGIKYSEMTATQKVSLEEDLENPENVEFEREQVDKVVFNKDTNRHVIRNLMEKGLRDGTGTKLGKSIIFARNHNHAVLLQELFNEMYPQYGGSFCRVIDSHDERAGQLIDDFKDTAKEPVIAVSVDMLDTGIDIPEILNLVFAKPVYSYVKFWQMIGRGTRLCKDLFGVGRDKTEFLIIDHWENFEFFEEKYKERQPKQPKALLVALFEQRLQLAEAALQNHDSATFELAISLIEKDINALPDKSISVNEKYKDVLKMRVHETLHQFSAATRDILSQEIAPLMQWRDPGQNSAAYHFDRLMAHMQVEKVKNSARFDDLKDKLLAVVMQLQLSINEVQLKGATLNKLKKNDFWKTVTVQELEEVRLDLRGIIHYQNVSGPGGAAPLVIDVSEDAADIVHGTHTTKLEGLQLVAYRKRVESVLKGLFNKSVPLQKIKAGQPVTESELKALVEQVLLQDSHIDLNQLFEVFPDTANHLDEAIRRIIGLDAEAVDKHFTAFIHKHKFTAHQLKFLSMLQSHIANYGAITVEKLYEPPFTTLDSNGVDGVFKDEKQLNELFQLISSISGPGKKEG